MTKRLLYLILLCCFIVLIIPNYNYCATLSPISNLSETIVSFLQEENDNGIIIDNVKLEGNDKQIGTFSDAEKSKSNIPGFENIDSGIFLTSGSIDQNVFVPNNSHPYPSYAFGDFFYSDKNRLKYVYDKASLSFDATSNTDTISFRFIFASEEFDQPPAFNDKMRILYKEESDSDYTDLTATFIEKTKSGKPGEISINNLRNTKYHYDNIKGKYFAFLGYTPLLTCKVNVEPGKKYNFRIEIEDVGDPIFDSALLIKAHSVSSNPTPPDSEENPDPPTRGLLAVNEYISAMKITLSDGQVMSIAEFEKDSSGKMKLRENAKNTFTIDLGTGKKQYNLFSIVEPTMLQGALLEIEYLIEIKNTGAETISEYKISSDLDKNIAFSTTSNLITENSTNSDFYLSIDKNGKGHAIFNGGTILPNETAQKKLVFSEYLSTEEKDFASYKNSGDIGVIYNSMNRENVETESFNSPQTTLIPPTGKSNNNYKYLLTVAIVLMFYLVILKCV